MSNIAPAESAPKGIKMRAARWLAGRGLYVFPLLRRKKLPAISGWKEAATTDEAVFAKWFSDDRYNIGVFTGRDLIVVDCDCKAENGDANFRALAGEHVADLDATLTVASPSGGRHYYFRGDPVKNSVRKLAPAVDIRSRGGLVAGPGSDNAEGKPYRVINEAPIADAPRWLLDAITECYVAAERVELATDVTLDTDAAVAQAVAFLADAPAAIEGQGGNDLTYRTAARLKDIGISDFMAGVLMGGEWNSRCAPPWDDDELAEVVAHAYAYGENSPGSASVEVMFDEIDDAAIERIGEAANDNRPSPRAILAASTLDLVALSGSPPPPREWLVEGLVPSSNVTLFYGDGGVGKSILALQLAAAVATGGQWLGLDVKAGPAIFLTAEDDRRELHRRLADIAAAAVMPFAELSALTAISLADAPIEAALAKADRDDRIKGTPLWRELVRLIGKRRPALLVLDTLADIFDGNENIRAQARAFITKLRRLAIQSGAAIVVIAHPSRAGLAEARELNSAAGSSGSTAWNNSVRSRLYLSRGEGDARRDPDQRVLTVMKANYANAGGKIRLRWTNGLFLPEGVAGGQDAAGQASEAERVFLELLDAYTNQGRRVGSSPSSTYAPKVFADDERSGMFDRHQLADAMNRLFASGAIRLVTEGPASKRRERIARASSDSDAA